MNLCTRTIRFSRMATCLGITFATLTACGVDTDSRNDVALPAANEPAQALATSQAVSGPATVSGPAVRLARRPAGSPLTGRMLGAARFDNTLRGVDLSTGRSSTLAGNQAFFDLGPGRDDASVDTRRDRSVASGVVFTADDCLREATDSICVLYGDRNGNLDDAFAIPGRFPGPAKTSFDGSHVMINRTDRAAGNSVITMYTRDGDVVSSHAQSGSMNGNGPYDWLPDGRMVFAIEGNELLGDAQPTGFFITDPFDTTPRRKITLPSFYQDGVIKSIESSPDGTTLLVNLEPRVGPTRPILIDLATLRVTQLIDRQDGGVTDTRNVVWGPNGKWVYAVVPTSKLLSGPGLAPGTIVFIGSFDSLFAFAVDGTVHPMPTELSDLSASLQLVPTDDPDRPGGQVGGGSYEGNLAWVP